MTTAFAWHSVLIDTTVEVVMFARMRFLIFFPRLNQVPCFPVVFPSFDKPRPKMKN